MSEIAIRVDNLSKQYRIGKRKSYKTIRESISSIFRPSAADQSAKSIEQTFWALKDVSFQVEKGAVIGIIGRNGAGKSTLLKILSRITEPTSGQVQTTGRVGSLLEVGTGFHPELTGRENVYLNGAILGMRKSEIEQKFDAIVAFAEVERFLDTQVKHYSSGMYMRLAFAVAAHLEPEILIVDEVLAVGDAQFQRKCMGQMGQVARDGRTVLFVSHNMGAIENLCKSCILLEGGRVIESGPTRQIVARYLEDILPGARNSKTLAQRRDRSGNGAIRLTSFRIEDENAQAIVAARSGMRIVFVFGFRCASPDMPARNVDVGMSISTSGEQTLCVLYGSYVGQVFPTVDGEGEFRCEIDSLPLSAGHYSVGARVVVAGDEADWPWHGVGEMEVESGDFFGTGNAGFGPDAPMLLRGNWKVSTAVPSDTPAKVGL